jgi:chromosome segregation ATPase
MRRIKGKPSAIKSPKKFLKTVETKVRDILKIENNIIKDDNDKTSLEVRQLKEKTISLKDDIRSLNDVFKKRKKELEKVSGMICIVNKKLKESEKHLNDNHSERQKECRAEIAQLDSKISSLKCDIHGLEKEKEYLISSNSNVKESIDKLNSLVKTNECHLSNVKEKTKEKKIVLSELDLKVNQYSDILSRKAETTEVLDKKILSLQTLLEEERKNLKKTVDANKLKEEELEEKNKKLEETQKKMFGLIKREKRINKIVPELQKIANDAGYTIKL